MRAQREDRRIGDESCVMSIASTRDWRQSDNTPRR
jgi:hypothetical protein